MSTIPQPAPLRPGRRRTSKPKLSARPRIVPCAACGLDIPEGERLLLPSPERGQAVSEPTCPCCTAMLARATRAWIARAPRMAW